MSLAIGMLAIGVGALGTQPATAEPPGGPPATSPPYDAPDPTPVGPSSGGSASAAPDTKALPAPVPLAPGQAVRHDFDVVLAHVYASPELIPPGPPVGLLAHQPVDEALTEAAGWWSDHTGLAFDFNQRTRYETINTTCATVEQDAFAALGERYDRAVYTESGRVLLIIQIDAGCDSYSGQALTVSPTGNVLAGGVIKMNEFGWDGQAGTGGPSPGVIIHEFGHTIGLRHSNALNCGGVRRVGDDRVGPLWNGLLMAGCASVEYGDVRNVMSGRGGGQVLGSLQRYYLGIGWDDGLVTGPATRQVFDIARDDAPAGQPRGVVVSTGSFLGSLDFRPATFGGPPGVYLILGTYAAGLRTDVAQPIGLAQPAVNLDPWPVALEPGVEFVSADGSVRFRTLSIGASTARVEVTVTELPGLPGDVAITNNAGVLTAVVGDLATPTPVTTGYQWFRNGEPIPGATSATYTPALPDPNAVYRVEATLQAPGRATTTQSSRGIIPDDHRLTATGSALTLTLLDQDGGGIDCAGLEVAVTIATPGGHAIGTRAVTLEATSETNVCRVPVDIPLTGDLLVTVAPPDDLGGRGEWRSSYLSPATVTSGVPATGATAGVMVGVRPPELIVRGAPLNGFIAWPDPTSEPAPALNVGSGTPPLTVTVSVSDGAGAPAAGVAVSLSSPVTGLVFDPATPVTDEYGFARAELGWDRSLPTPEATLETTIDVAVPGVAKVTGAPARVWLWQDGSPQVAAWFEGNTSVMADEVDAARLHVRVWDEAGGLISDQADRLSARLAGSSVDWPSVIIGDAVWDPASDSYVMTVRSGVVQTVNLTVMFKGSFAASRPTVPVKFTAGPLARLGVATSDMSANEGNCDGADVPEATVWAFPEDAYGHSLGWVDGGVVFSLPAGSPLKFTSNPAVTGPSLWGSGGPMAYRVTVTSAVPGRFEVRIKTADGSYSASGTVQVADGLIDPAKSSVVISAGPRLANGTDSYTVTATLVSMCHLPVRSLGTREESGTNSYWLDLVGSPAGVTVVPWQADPAHPGVYRATVTSRTPGTYALTAQSTLRAWAYPLVEQDTVTPVNANPLMARFVTEVEVVIPTGGWVSPGAPGGGLPVGGSLVLLGAFLAIAAGFRGRILGQTGGKTHRFG